MQNSLVSAVRHFYEKLFWNPNTLHQQNHHQCRFSYRDAVTSGQENFAISFNANKSLVLMYSQLH